MLSQKPPLWTPPHGAVSQLALDTLPSARLQTDPDLGDLGVLSDLGDGDTVFVPLTSAETLPCPRLALDDLPTLRVSPMELAELVKLTRRPAALSVDPPPVAQPASAARPVRLADPGQTTVLPGVPAVWPPARPLPPRGMPPQALAGPIGEAAMMPTQLWLGVVAPPAAATAVAPTPRARRTSAPRSLWARLWSLLGFSASAKPRYPARRRHRPLRR